MVNRPALADPAVATTPCPVADLDTDAARRRPHFAGSRQLAAGHPATDRRAFQRAQGQWRGTGWPTGLALA